jgi:hypothetical protein
MTRDEMIELLIDDDINGWRDRDDQVAYLAMLLRDGFTGYANQSDREIEDELFDRGIVEEWEIK